MLKDVGLEKYYTEWLPEVALPGESALRDPKKLRELLDPLVSADLKTWVPRTSADVELLKFHMERMATSPFTRQRVREVLLHPEFAKNPFADEILGKLRALVSDLPPVRGGLRNWTENVIRSAALQEVLTSQERQKFIDFKNRLPCSVSVGTLRRMLVR
jgi:hypothetical protein